MHLRLKIHKETEAAMGFEYNYGFVGGEIMPRAIYPAFNNVGVYKFHKRLQYMQFTFIILLASYIKAFCAKRQIMMSIQ